MQNQSGGVRQSSAHLVLISAASLSASMQSRRNTTLHLAATNSKAIRHIEELPGRSFAAGRTSLTSSMTKADRSRLNIAELEPTAANAALFVSALQNRAGDLPEGPPGRAIMRRIGPFVVHGNQGKITAIHLSTGPCPAFMTGSTDPPYAIGTGMVRTVARLAEVPGVSGHPSCKAGRKTLSKTMAMSAGRPRWPG
jgi:hypothetical protein